MPDPTPGGRPRRGVFGAPVRRRHPPGGRSGDHGNLLAGFRRDVLEGSL